MAEVPDLVAMNVPPDLPKVGEFVTYPGSPFQLFQPYPPAGDQPTAIEKLVEGLNDGLSFQTLLGVTGSGKTFTMANVIAQMGRTAIVFAPNKTLAAQLYSEFREFFPKNAVEYFVSYYDYYQPEAYVPQRDLFIEKDSSINDQIEPLQLFDPLTGRIRQKVPRFTVYPSSHYVTPRERVVDAITTIKDELRGRLAELVGAGKLVEAQRLEQRTRFDLEMLQEVGHCKGIENYTRHLSGAEPGDPPPVLVDYLPKDALMFLDESHVLIGQLGGMFNGDRARKTVLVEYGFRLPSALDNRPLKFEEFERKVRQVMYVSATPDRKSVV